MSSLVHFNSLGGQKGAAEYNWEHKRTKVQFEADRHCIDGQAGLLSAALTFPTVLFLQPGSEENKWQRCHLCFLQPSFRVRWGLLIASTVALLLALLPKVWSEETLSGVFCVPDLPLTFSLGKQKHHGQICREELNNRLVPIGSVCSHTGGDCC